MPTDASVPAGFPRAILAAFNAHDLDAVMAFFADDCSLDMPRGPEPWGRRAVGDARVVRKDSYWKIVEVRLRRNAGRCASC